MYRTRSRQPPKVSYCLLPPVKILPRQRHHVAKRVQIISRWPRLVWTRGARGGRGTIAPGDRPVQERRAAGGRALPPGPCHAGPATLDQQVKHGRVACRPARSTTPSVASVGRTVSSSRPGEGTTTAGPGAARPCDIGGGSSGWLGDKRASDAIASTRRMGVGFRDGVYGAPVSQGVIEVTERSRRRRAGFG
jgi:hypothetical protein